MCTTVCMSRHEDGSLNTTEHSYRSYIYFFAERSPKKKLSQPGQKGAIIVVGKLSNIKDFSSKEPEKSDDAPSTSKVPGKADDNPSTSKDSDSSSFSSLVEVTTPRTLTPSPVPKPCCLIPSPARLPESSDSSDSSVEEIQSLSPVPKPSRCIVPSSSHIPTFETASPVTNP